MFAQWFRQRLSFRSAVSATSEAHFRFCPDRLRQEPITRSLQPPHTPVTALSQTDLFLAEFISNSDPHRNLSDQLQSQARTNVDMFTWGRIVLFLQKRAHVDWNWPISLEKYLKIDWSTCKNAVALAYYGSCRLLLMGSYLRLVFSRAKIALLFTSSSGQPRSNSSLVVRAGLEPATLAFQVCRPTHSARCRHSV